MHRPGEDHEPPTAPKPLLRVGERGGGLAGEAQNAVGKRSSSVTRQWERVADIIGALATAALILALFAVAVAVAVAGVVRRAVRRRPTGWACHDTRCRQRRRS